jgi:hypothetical protein
MYRCDGCGYFYDLSTYADAPAQLQMGAAEFAALLREGGAEVAIRPEPDTWSPLEYGCHVRDVLLVQSERVLAARRTDHPNIAPMGRDERVEHDGYAEQDPADVARQLTDAAAMLTNVFRRLDPDDWDRTMHYNYPRPAERPLRWVAVHAAHEVHHHLLDAQRGPG